MREGPGVAAGVLLHFQRGRGHASGVGGLARAEQDAGVLEDRDGFTGRGHVGTLRHREQSVARQPGGGVAVELVLRGARQRDGRVEVPDGATVHVVDGGAPGLVVLEPSALDLLDLAQQRDVNPGLVHDVAGGVRAGHDGGAKGLGLGDRVDGDVAGAGDHNALAVEGLAAGLEHLLGEDDGAVAGGLGPHQRAAPGHALAGEDAGFVAVGDPLVLPEEVADFAAADADVPGRDVRVLADVAVELGHEGLAEAHDLGVRASAGVEVGAALAAADGHAGQGILEDLFEPEELHNAKVHRGVEPQASLEGSQRRVELHPEAAVDLKVAGVVDPGDPEDDLPFGLAEPFEDGAFEELGVAVMDRAEAFEDLGDRLVEFLFAGIPSQHRVPDGFKPCVHCNSLNPGRPTLGAISKPFHGCTGREGISIRAPAGVPCD